MRVLLTEERAGDAAAAATALAGRGHAVEFCHPEPDDDTRCLAMQFGGTCPIDVGDVDLVVDVRGGGSPTMQLREYGAVCALRTGTPLVVATDAEGFLPEWAAEVCATGDVADVCENVGAGAGAQAVRDVTNAVRLTLHRLTGDGRARVHLIDHGYFVEAVVYAAVAPGEKGRRELLNTVRRALRPYRDDWVHTALRVAAMATPQTPVG